MKRKLHRGTPNAFEFLLSVGKLLPIKRMQTDLTSHYATCEAADAGRYVV